MKKYILQLSMVVAALALAGPVVAEVEGPNVNWRIATFGTPRAATTHIETIKKHVEDRTNGRFSISLGYGTFGELREFLDLLNIGAIHGATVLGSVSVDRLPLYTGLDLPFLPLSDPDVQRAVHEAVHEHPAIVAEFAAWNAMPFMSSLLPQYELLGTTATPESLADIDGMRIRALGGNGDALAKLGAVPANMPPAEVYVALDRGLITAAALPYYAHVAFRTYEHGRWMTTNMGLAGTAFPVVFNKSAWDELPPQYQALMLEAREIAYEAQQSAIVRDNVSSFEAIREAGVELIQFDEADLVELRRIGAQPVWEEWVASRAASGLPGQEILDFILNAIEQAERR